MAYDIFISYRRDDLNNQITGGEALAENLYEALANDWQYKVFLDRETMRVGNWRDQIEAALSEAHTAVIIISQNCFGVQREDDVFIKEIKTALARNINVIPVQAQGGNINSVPDEIFELKNRQCLTEKIVSKLASILAKEITPPKELIEEKLIEIRNKARQFLENDGRIDISEMEKLRNIFTRYHLSPQDVDRVIREEEVIYRTGNHNKPMNESEQQVVSRHEDVPPANIVAPFTPAPAPYAHSSVEVEWPKVGIQFLNRVFDRVSPHLSFTPESVSEPDQIEEERCAWWYIKDKHHIAIELDKKRADNISVLWGFYSENEKRDPLFRKIAADLESQGVLAVTGKGSYSFMPDNYTKLFAERRVNIAELADQAFVDEIVKKLIEFCEILWKVAQKYYQQGGEEDVQVESNEPTPATVSADSLFSGLEWPELGHAFLKEIRKSVDVSLLPFNPVVVSSDEDIEDRKDPEIDWDINDMLYFSVWFSRKYGDKVTLTWGFFAVNEQRDPIFRTTFDPNKNNEFGELSDNDGCVLLNGAYYFFDSSDSLRFVAEKKLVMSAINQDLVLEISQHVIAATNKFWPVVRKHYENQAGA